MKEVGRKKINWDSIITVELSLKELQLIKDSLGRTGYEVMKELWSPGNPPYIQPDKEALINAATSIINSYK